jgi:hypothetical protein
MHNLKDSMGMATISSFYTTEIFVQRLNVNGIGFH